MGRGGSAGQQIRDEILVIMHAHDIKERWSMTELRGVLHLNDLECTSVMIHVARLSVCSGACSRFQSCFLAQGDKSEKLVRKNNVCWMPSCVLS